MQRHGSLYYNAVYGITPYVQLICGMYREI